MKLLAFIKQLLMQINNIDNGVKTKFRFSQKEMSEILSIAKKSNLKYFETLSKMQNLRYFDISYLLSQVELNDEKIQIIKKAQEMFNTEEFKLTGQTQSDFIFRVASNLDYLSLDNLEVFKEVAKCKNELYDFKNALQNPTSYLKTKEYKLNYAFEKVYYED